MHINIKIQRDGPDDVNDLVTDEQGLCKIDFGDLRTNYIMIKVHKEHFVPADIRVSKAEDETHISAPSSYTLALEPGTSIGGFVRNVRRGPIEAATVFLRASGGATSPRFWIWDYEEKTDANGFWQCDIMPAEIGHISIRLAHPDYIDDESYNARSTPPLEELRAMTGVMVMNEGVNLAGTVVDSNGQPIAKASVRQGQENTWGIIYPHTETDEEGRFEFANTRAGRVMLTVQAKGYAPESREISVRYGMQPVEFQLGPAQTIRGRVVDAADKPIEGVEVSLESWQGGETIKWQTKTDAEGYFQWNEAPKDEMKFAFFKEGYRAIRFLEMTPDVDEHIIVMDAAMKVSGKVVDADSNEPISEFKLILGDRPIQRPDSLISWDRESARTFTGGRYELEFDGRDLYFSRNSCYFIRVEAEGHVPDMSSQSFTQEQDNVVIDFKLQKGQGPSGTIYLPDGEPAAGAKVALSTASHPVFISGGRLEDDKRWQSVTAGPDGRFSFPAQIEKYLVVAVHNKGYAEAMEEELAAEPNIVIQPWGSVEGVLCVGGRVLAGESVGLEYLRDYEQRVPSVSFHYSIPWTDANGCFAVKRMVPGKVKIYHLFKMAGTICARTRSEIIDVSPGRTTYVTIGGSGRAVTGKFVAIGYEPSWHRGQVSLDLKLPEPARPNDYNEMIFVERREWDDNWRGQTEEGRLYERMERTQRGRSYRAKIERDGTFRVDDVPPGEYELRACLGSEIGGKVIWGPRKPVPPPDHVFVVPDVNETDSNQPLDLGEIRVRHEEYPGADPAPVFEAVTFDGERTNLLAFRGKVVLLTFWRSEPSILSELDYARQLAGNYKTNERFIALGMSLDRDVGAAKKFAKDNGFEWINCFPTPGTRAEVADDYEIWKFPMTFVIDPYGYILTVDPTPLRFESKVKEWLAPR
ncbi:MAG: carboxypeptidase regulatory-like domain-containing protein [Planctomycetota bacterium]